MTTVPNSEGGWGGADEVGSACRGLCAWPALPETGPQLPWGFLFPFSLLSFILA